MLYEFKSRRTGTVTMTQSVAERLLEIMGKTPGPTGIITVEQIPAAIEALERAVRHEPPPPPESDDPHERAEDPNKYVSLGQRTWPLIEMMMLGLVAYRAGKKIAYDGGRMTTGDAQADAFLRRTYREGWPLNG